MEPINLKIEPTTNDKVLKLTANKMLVKGNFHYQHSDEASNAPLAQELFQLPFIKQVYFSANFIALERHDFVEWPAVQEDIKEQLERYLNDGGKLVNNVETKKYPIEVFAESTPNPEVLKFVTNVRLVTQDYEFKNVDEAKSAPIAQQLFQMPFVKEIFISGAYIAVTKTNQVEWPEVQNELRNFIREYLSGGNPVVTESTPVKENSMHQEVEPTDEVSKQIIGILNEYIRPAVTADGGNILFQSYDEQTKVVNVVLQGACSGCPSSTITLKNGIENMLKQLIPGKIEEVVAINQ